MHPMSNDVDKRGQKCHSPGLWPVLGVPDTVTRQSAGHPEEGQTSPSMGFFLYL